jgi:hypothetical protein
MSFTTGKGAIYLICSIVDQNVNAPKLVNRLINDFPARHARKTTEQSWHRVFMQASKSVVRYIWSLARGLVRDVTGLGESVVSDLSKPARNKQASDRVGSDCTEPLQRCPVGSRELAFSLAIKQENNSNREAGCAQGLH